MAKNGDANVVAAVCQRDCCDTEYVRFAGIWIPRTPANLHKLLDTNC
jgi:hypothetical protein